MEFFTKAQIIINNTKSFLYYFHDKKEMFIEAAEYFSKAGNSYKIDGHNLLAVNSYICAFKILRDNKIEIPETINYLLKAAETETDLIVKIKFYKRLIKYCNKIGNIDRSERYLTVLAKLFENDNNFEDALKIYEILVNTYTKDGPTKDSYKLKIFQYSTKMEITVEQLLKNGKILELIGNSNKRYTSNIYYFNSILCYLAAGDIVLANQKLENLEWRHFEFIKNIIKSIEDQNMEIFSNLCFNFDNITKLDSSQTILLLIIKKQIHDDIDLS